MLACMEHETPAAQQSPVRLGRTLRRAVRQSWDSLGLVCAASLTLFAACVPVALFWYALSPWFIVRLVGGWVAASLALAPLMAGVCYLVNQVLEHDEPSYLDVWRGARRMFARAVAVGSIQLAVQGSLIAGVVFYATRGSLVLTALAAVCVYALVFWWAMCLYQWPLLVAAEVGLLRRDDGGTPTLRSVFRNSALLALAAPGYACGLLLVLAAVEIPLIASGVGAALLGSGFLAFAATQATRDQLVRYGAIPPPPDTEGPAPDEPWRVA